MAPDVARAALAFLERTDLKGGEVIRFMQVVRELQAIAAPSGPDKSNVDAADQQRDE